MKFKSLIAVGLMILFVNTAHANALYWGDSTITKAPTNWFNLDQNADNVKGVSTEQAYKTLLKGKPSTTVVVAVIDSGIDVEHEDLKDKIWTNEDEIAGNGIDDDKNGYVDDIHGWNFIGGKNGENVIYDTYELTRLYARMSKQYKGVNGDKLKGKKKARYERYLEIKKKFEKASKEAKAEYMQLKQVLTLYKNAYKMIEKDLGGKPLTIKNVEAIKSDNDDVNNGKQFILLLLNNGATAADLLQLEEIIDSYRIRAEYGYNEEYNPRTIVGDNYLNSKETGYGNNDVKGKFADHGTHVAGIIGANRSNELGMKGIAENIQIMAIRAVPNGDERDKDVANAIRYAVDNGASVVNMSFGKGYAFDKKAVDKAIKYAMKKDVLLVHGAGNDAKNTDYTDNFPNDRIGKKNKEVNNWIEVGALNWQTGDKAIADFSNYGKKNVDIFAPGVDIYSTTPDQKYQDMSGTSMASPVVAGVAALIRSYFPTLTAAQVKEVLLSSSIKSSEQVNKPGTDATATLKDLCKTGGMVNVVEAVKKAVTTKGKKKIKKKKRKKKKNRA